MNQWTVDVDLSLVWFTYKQTLCHKVWDWSGWIRIRVRGSGMKWLTWVIFGRRGEESRNERPVWEMNRRCLLSSSHTSIRTHPGLRGSLVGGARPDWKMNQKRERKRLRWSDSWTEVEQVERVVEWSEGCWFESLAELSCMSKCPWARYWTPNCSWCAVCTMHGDLCHQCLNVSVSQFRSA